MADNSKLSERIAELEREKAEAQLKVQLMEREATMDKLKAELANERAASKAQSLMHAKVEESFQKGFEFAQRTFEKNLALARRDAPPPSAQLAHSGLYSRMSEGSSSYTSHRSFDEEH